MKRIGIITFQESTSIGANLQAFALQTFLSNAGYSVDMINYDRHGDSVPVSDKRGRTSPKTVIKEALIKTANFIFSLAVRNDRRIKAERLEAFRRDDLNISSRRYHNYSELESDPPVYDCYITGSDQVWNPLTGLKIAYLLAFAPKNSLKIAYAPSIGTKCIPENMVDVYRKYLKQYEALSCREKAGAEVLSEISGREVKTVLDPTLLLDRAEWEKYEHDVYDYDDFLLCYFLGSLKQPRRIAARIAREKGLKIIAISGSPVDVMWNVKKASGVGPKEFLALVRKASFICTDSFHGTAFAINYGKPFLTFQRRGYNSPNSFGSRLENILSLTGLSERLIKENTKCSDAIEIACKQASIGKVLDSLRCESMQYLLNALISGEVEK